MRPLLALVILALVAGMSAPWWGRGTAAPPGAVVIAVGGAVTLDPTQASTLEEFRILAALCEGLVRVDPATLATQPALAERWSCDVAGTMWTFTLGERAWSDGSPVTAQEMAAGLELHRSASASSSLLSGVTTITAEGGRALRIATRTPMPWLPSVLATPVFVPRHPSMDRPQAWSRPLAVIGNGPLRCVGETPRHHLDLAPSPTYRGPHPAAGPLRLLTVDDAGTAVRLYLDGRVDAVLRLTSDTIGDLVRAKREDLQRSASWGTELYRVRGTVPLPLRQALARSIDREAIVRELLHGNGVPATTLVPASAGMLGYHPAERAVVRTETLPGQELELLVPSNQAERLRTGEWLCDRWKRDLGITVALTAVPSNQAASRVKALDYSIARGSLVGDYLDPAYFLECFRGTSGMNRTGWSDAEYERLLDAAAADPARRLALLAQAEARLLDAAVVIPLYHYACAFLVRPTVSGIQANTLELVHYSDVRATGAAPR